MNSSLPRNPNKFEITKEQLDEALKRAVKQEAIYGHNSGHFSLLVEKENTTIGVLGEIVVRDYLKSRFNHKNEFTIELTEFGAPYDIQIRTDQMMKAIHVKSGLWKTWPRDNWHFGIHADQGIQNTSAPLVLVSFLKSKELLPQEARIEGFLNSTKLKSAKIIKKGEKFPSTNVVSRTENYLTQFRDYQSIEKIDSYVNF